MKEALIFLESLLNNNDTIVVGVSGGPDSMCLLSLLISLRAKLNLHIICAHINHGLRRESLKEAKFVENYCVANNIIFEYMKITGYTQNKFTEQEARSKRYDFFAKLVKKYQAQYLMTAHHGNDLEETILMRIVRGSNLKGYIGIPQINRNKEYILVRPLLMVNKNQILQYLKTNNIKYCLDKSNNNCNYTRNRFRKQMLPFLEKEDENVHLKFLKFSEELNEYHTYINELIKPKVNKIYQDEKINLLELNKEDEFIQKKIIEYVIEIIQQQEIFNINDKNINAILNLIKEKGNKQISLADNFIARKSYDYLYIEKNNKEKGYRYEFNNQIKILDKYVIKKIANTHEKSNFIIRLNSQEIKLPLFVRTVQNGDKIKVKNLNGNKKVNDIFIDNKIDLIKRKTYPLVVDNENTIIWVPGIKKSIFDKEIFEKYDIILKYMEEKDEYTK